ncbi:MAG: hypothetical protein AAF921_20175 [Cyanobacteria bacterium P01_D01_bin.44]
MYFPLWQYLNQPLWDSARPPTLSPFKYWQWYKVQRLNRCFKSHFLEQCWAVSYQDFVTAYPGFCDRNALEEEPIWLLERCWQLQRSTRYSSHPENQIQDFDSM